MNVLRIETLIKAVRETRGTFFQEDPALFLASGVWEIALQLAILNEREAEKFPTREEAYRREVLGLRT